MCSGDWERAWIWGVCRSSVKTKVSGFDVARVMRSEAARGELADLARARKGCILISVHGLSMAITGSLPRERSEL